MHDWPLLLTMQGADEIDQVPDVVGAQHRLPGWHGAFAIGNPIRHDSVREIRRWRDPGQILWPLRKKRRSRSIPDAAGAMARFAVLMEQYSSPLDGLRRAWDRVARNRSPQKVEVVDANANGCDESGGKDPLYRSPCKHVVRGQWSQMRYFLPTAEGTSSSPNSRAIWVCARQPVQWPGASSFRPNFLRSATVCGITLSLMPDRCSPPIAP